jgi:c-di-GMP-binding flagellar brake protein YcgR
MRSVQLVQERRSNTRVSVPYNARIRAVDAAGRPFREDTHLDDLSVGGLYLRLTRKVPKGSTVTVAVRLSTVPPQQAPALRLAARGTVLRTEEQPDGTWGVAVEFKRRRIL